MERNRGKRALKIAGMVCAGMVFAVAFALAFGFVVQYLWNFLMPDLFGLKAITYWQGFALVLLAKIFFGSFGRHHGVGRRGHGHGRWHGWSAARCGWEGMEMSEETLSHYRDFWEKEGKKAFEEYMRKIREGKE